MIHKTPIFYAALLFLAACSGGTGSDNKSVSMTDSSAVSDQANTENNSTAALITELEKIAPLEDYKVVGDIHVEELTFNEFSMGDMAHILFTDSKNETHDFAGNVTDTKLFLETDENIEENMGYLSNPQYVGKKFRVGWRHVKLTRQPADYIEEFYSEYDEIIYLKQLN